MNSCKDFLGGVRMKIFGVKDNEKKYIYRPGVYAIMVKNDRIATVKSSLGYFLIGGGLEADENPEDCLKREALEEVGHAIEILERLESVEEYVTVKFSGVSYLKHMTAFKAVMGKFVQLPIEIDHELVWLTKAEAIESLFLEGQRYFVEMYI